MTWPISTSLNELAWTTRAGNALRNEGLLTIQDVVSFGEERLRRIPNVGRVTVSEIVSTIRDAGHKVVRYTPAVTQRPKPKPDPIERIATALERIADHLDRHAAEG